MKSIIFKEVKSTVLDLKNKPLDASDLETQLLFGEKVKIIKTKNDWSCVCSVNDNYQGWIKNQNIGNITKKNYKIKNVSAFVYTEPNIKSKVIIKLFLNSSVQLINFENNWAKILVGNKIGFIHENTLSKLNKNYKNWIDICLKFRYVPYLWGGKTFEGIDCSGLVQLSLQFCNINFPRNTTEQVNFKSHHVKSSNKISKGCLLFWDGHVGVSLNKHELIHSNLYHLGVEIEEIDTCIKRIGKIKEIKKVII